MDRPRNDESRVPAGRVSDGKRLRTYGGICERFRIQESQGRRGSYCCSGAEGVLGPRERARTRSKLVNLSPGIPLFGRISAGRPKKHRRKWCSTCRSILPLSVSVNVQSVRGSRSGDSMIGRHIFDGDIVLLGMDRYPAGRHRSRL